MIEAQLKDGHIGFGIDVAQHAPRSVVKSPLVIGEQVLLKGAALGFFGCARRRILHLIERRGERVEIMDGPRVIGRENVAASGNPVGRNSANSCGGIFTADPCTPTKT